MDIKLHYSKHMSLSPQLSPIPEVSPSLESGLNDLLTESSSDPLDTDNTDVTLLMDPSLSDSTASASPSASESEITIIPDRQSLSGNVSFGELPSPILPDNGWSQSSSPSNSDSGSPSVPEVPAVEAPSVPAVEAPSVPAVEVPSVPAVEVPSVPAVEVPSVPAVEVPSDNNKVDTVSHEVYNNLITLLNGTSFDANNWVILLTKSMTLVSQVKGLNKAEKVTMCVNLVIRYLDEKTDLSDDTLKFIKSSVEQMCINLLDGQSSIKSGGSSGKLDIKIDPDMLITPIQIIGSLVNKIQSTTDKKRLAVEISAVVLMCISVVDKYRHLTGIEKKDIVIAAITQYINQSVLPGMDTNSAEYSVINMLLAGLPNIIDTCVAVAKGKPAFKFDFKDPETRNCILRFLTAVLSSCSNKTQS